MIFSIITPVYNREDCIKRCLDSVLNNLSDDFSVQHIVVDDGSTDNTPSILDAYSKKYSHIDYNRMDSNCGTNAARNLAIKLAKGDYCIFLDSDDYFADDSLSKLFEVVKHKQYLHYCFVPSDMVPYYEQIHLFEESNERVLTFRDFLSGKYSVDFVHCMKTEVLKKFSFDESLRIYEGIFFLQIYKAVKTILVSNILITIRERSREDSVTRDVIRTSKRIIENNFQAESLQLAWFLEDYKHYGLIKPLNALVFRKVENGILLSKYKLVKNDLDILAKCKTKKYYQLKVLYFLRCGFLYRILLSGYLTIKYNFFKVKMRSW